MSVVRAGLQLSIPADPERPRPIPPRHLSEEDYVDVLSRLIERDFFPDLPRLRLEHQVLSAERKGDAETARAARDRLIPLKVEQAEDGPQTVDDLESNKRLTLIDGREVVVDLSNITLNNFQNLYTSDDNSSFQDLYEREIEKKRKQQSWMMLTDRPNAPEKPGNLKLSLAAARNPFIFEHNATVSQPRVLGRATVVPANTQLLPRPVTGAGGRRRVGPSIEEQIRDRAMIRDGIFNEAAPGIISRPHPSQFEGIMTYGHVNSMPVRLKEESSRNRYSIPLGSDRDAVVNHLIDKAAKRRRGTGEIKVEPTGRR